MRFLAVVALLAGCGDDYALRVRIDYERPPVPRTVISVYESPVVTCEQIALGDLDEAQLAALLVAEQSIGTVETGTLEGISRTDPKLIVVRAYSETGELLEAGCERHEIVHENDEVTVSTHVIATVSAEPRLVEPFRIDVLVTDRDGRALEDRRPISWRMYGPLGSEPTTNVAEMEPTADGNWQPREAGCANANGVTSIFPVTPNVIGGFAMSVRVAWANQAQTLFSGVTNTDFALTNLDIPPETKHPCTVSVKTSGATVAKRLVCVDRAGGQTFARAFPITVANGVATLGTPVSVMLGVRPPVALLALPIAEDLPDRDAYAIDRDGQLVPLFGATPPQTTTCPACANAVADAMIAPACGRDPARLLIEVAAAGVSDRVFVTPARGGVATEIDTAAGPETTSIRLNNAGCVTANGPQGYEPRQLVVLDVATPTSVDTRGFYNCQLTGCRRVGFPVAGSAIAFTRSSPPYVIGTAADATGLVLATWGLLPDPTNQLFDLLVERDARVPSAAVPNHLAVGNFDEGDGADMVWDLALRGRTGTTFALAYSKPAENGRLQALSAPQQITVIDLLATDVTNDDHDDIIVVAQRAAPTEAGVTIVPTQVIAPPKSIPVSTCGS